MDFRGNGVGRVAVIGIAGVGKEYIRELHSLGLDDLAVVDFGEVMAREISADGRMHNSFPEHEFDVRLKPGTPQIPAETGVDGVAHRLQSSGVTHIIHATPPTRTGRTLFRGLRDRGWSHHVEKPYMSHYLDPDISVGYLFRYLEALPRTTVHMSSPYQLGGWRDTLPMPIVWDLIVHVLSMWPEEEVYHIAAHWQPLGRIKLFSQSFSATVEYSSVVEQYEILETVERDLDWNAAFSNQLSAFLSEEHVVTPAQAIFIEEAASRIERELSARRSTTTQ